MGVGYPSLRSALTSHYLTRCSIQETKMPDVTLEPPVTLQHCDPRTHRCTSKDALYSMPMPPNTVMKIQSKVVRVFAAFGTIIYPTVQLYILTELRKLPAMSTM